MAVTLVWGANFHYTSQVIVCYVLYPSRRNAKNWGAHSLVYGLAQL